MVQTPEQTALIALQSELENTRGQLLGLGQRFDSLAQAHTALQQTLQQANDTLRADTGNAFAQKASEIQAMEQTLKGLMSGKQFDLLDLKNMRPEPYKGNRSENWRPWARKFKAYCNGKAEGFRGALDWAEKETTPIQHLGGCPWGKASAADSKLHDFLLATLGGEAVMLAETPGLEGKGFETWRQLVAKFSPMGGSYEMDMLSAIMSPPQAKDLTSLAGAIGRFERDWKLWEKQSGERFPERFKVTALLKIFPKSPQTDDLKWRFMQGLTDYNNMISQVVSYSQHIRHQGAYGRGDNDMAVDSLAMAAPGQAPAMADWIEYKLIKNGLRAVASIIPPFTLFFTHYSFYGPGHPGGVTLFPSWNKRNIPVYSIFGRFPEGLPCLVNIFILEKLVKVNFRQMFRETLSVPPSPIPDFFTRFVEFWTKINYKLNNRMVRITEVSNTFTSDYRFRGICVYNVQNSSFLVSTKIDNLCQKRIFSGIAK